MGYAGTPHYINFEILNCVQPALKKIITQNMCPENQAYFTSLDPLFRKQKDTSFNGGSTLDRVKRI